MPIYTGKSADGSDMHEALGVFINPDNENEWSNKPYNKEQRQQVKDHRTKVELLEYMNGRFSLDDCYTQIKENKFPLVNRIKKYVVSHYDEESNFCVIENLSPLIVHSLINNNKASSITQSSSCVKLHICISFILKLF